MTDAQRAVVAVVCVVIALFLAVVFGPVAYGYIFKLQSGTVVSAFQAAITYVVLGILLPIVLIGFAFWVFLGTKQGLRWWADNVSGCFYCGKLWSAISDDEWEFPEVLVQEQGQSPRGYAHAKCHQEAFKKETSKFGNVFRSSGAT